MDNDNQYDIGLLHASLELQDNIDLFLEKEYDDRQISIVEEMKDMAQRIASPNITVGRKLYTNRIARLHRVLLSSERLLLLQSEQTLADSKNIFKRGNLKAVVENRRDAIDIIGLMETQISFFQKQFPLKEKAKPSEDNSEPEQ